MNQQRIVIGCLAALALAVYLWAALSGPVVLWADSHVDLMWARAGLGIFRPVPPPAPGVAVGHLAKPGYLLFLRGATHLLPMLGETRSIVVVQSLLLWGSILATSLWLSRRRGISGLLFCLVAFGFLRIRDASSAVMPETLAAAGLMPIAALLIEPPEALWTFLPLGLAGAALFLVRPNCGGVILCLAIIVLLLARRGKSLFLFLSGFAVLVIPFWLLGRSTLPGDPLHGLGIQILEGSADYYWRPSVGPWPTAGSPRQISQAQLKQAAQNWKRTLTEPSVDRRRQLIWRGLHGLLGTEFYDSRWSKDYAIISTSSRLISPFLVLGALVLLAMGPWRGPASNPRVMGLLLLALLLGQNLLLGSNPRYVLPFLPALFLLALCAAVPSHGGNWKLWLLFAVVFGGLTALLAGQRGVFDWQWGQIERAGLTLTQRIPQGSLPSREPAVLHIRIAPPVPQCGAHFTVSAGGKTLFSSTESSGRERPEIRGSLPASVLEQNQRGAIDLTVTSTGDYGFDSYLLFPIVPPPWGPQAHRNGSAMLSPATGIRWGSLDWWVHQGTP